MRSYDDSGERWVVNPWPPAPNKQKRVGVSPWDSLKWMTDRSWSHWVKLMTGLESCKISALHYYWSLNTSSNTNAAKGYQTELLLSFYLQIALVKWCPAVHAIKGRSALWRSVVQSPPTSRELVSWMQASAQRQAGISPQKALHPCQNHAFVQGP